MKIVDFVRPDLVVPDLSATDKPGIIEELASHIAERVPVIDRDKLARALMEREKLASTGIDQGVAIPHAKMRDLGSLVACVGRKKDGVDFASMDCKPSHLFFVLVAPENSTGVHLKALARISRLFRDPGFRSRLLEAPDAAALYQTIVDEDAKH
jgi:PTS system nitrogen regulatory IIA component